MSTIEKDRTIENSIIEGTINIYENERLRELRSYAFYTNSSLTLVNLPLVQTIEDCTFYFCTNLASINLPLATTIGYYAFGYCSALTSINLPSITTVGNYAFRYCYNLLSLYLTNNTICTLSNSNAFNQTPIAGYTTSTGGVYGSIYVPASLYSNYITATNWTAYSSRFVSI